MKTIRDLTKDQKSKSHNKPTGMTESEALLSDIEPESLAEAETARSLENPQKR